MKTTGLLSALALTTINSAAAQERGNLRSRSLFALDANEVATLVQDGVWSVEDANNYLNLECRIFTGEDCWSNEGNRRALEDADLSFNDEKLLNKYPDNREDFKCDKDCLMAFMSTGEWSNIKYQHLNVRYIKLEGSGKLGTMVVSPGQSEPVAKYAETLHDFVEAGYSPVYCIDHVGQGESDRLSDDHHFLQHINSKDQFVGAFKKFLDEVVPTSSDEKRFMACHSMGCAVAFTLLMDDWVQQRPTRFHSMVANAPLIKADTSPFPYPIALAIGDLMVDVLGLGDKPAPTKDETFEQAYGNDAFEGATTSSLQRWLRQRNMCNDLKDVNFGDDEHKGICLGGLTANFAREFFRLYSGFEDFMKGVGKIATPVMIQVAGKPNESDGRVMNAETDRFCSESLKHCEIKYFEESKHNIWWETDSIRSGALEEALEFFEENSGTMNQQCPPPANCGSWVYDWPWNYNGCADPNNCSYQLQLGDYHLGMSCRPRNDVC